MMHSARLRTRFWADTRFLIGVALILLAIGGVWLIVSSSRQTTPFLQTNRTITPGEQLSARDFNVVEIGSGISEDSYLAPHELASGMVSTRTLAAGELLPRAAITEAERTQVTRVVIESSVALPESIVAGSTVELWFAPPQPEDSRAFDTPRILVPHAIVASLPQNDGVLHDSRSAVELVIDRADVQAVLAAITSGSALHAVPTGDGS